MFRYLNSICLLHLLLAAFVLSWTGCGDSSDSLPTTSISSSSSAETEITGDASSTPQLTEPTQLVAGAASTETPARVQEATGPPEVVIKTDHGDVRIRLNSEKAPFTVRNFLTNYVDRGFYDGTVFHFVEKEFILAAGGFDENLDPKEPRADIVNEAGNGLKNVRGTVAMSRAPEYINSANCQFYINLVDNPSLDHQSEDDGSTYGYCVFGEVVEGMDVVDKLAEVPVENRENFPRTPKKPLIIRSIQQVQ
jgi:cyclophilin family peptidyl-prolyl cis-trans isomerase